MKHGLFVFKFVYVHRFFGVYYYFILLYRAWDTYLEFAQYTYRENNRSGGMAAIIKDIENRKTIALNSRKSSDDEEDEDEEEDGDRSDVDSSDFKMDRDSFKMSMTSSNDEFVEEGTIGGDLSVGGSGVRNKPGGVRTSTISEFKRQRFIIDKDDDNVILLEPLDVVSDNINQFTEDEDDIGDVDEMFTLNPTKLKSTSKLFDNLDLASPSEISVTQERSGEMMDKTGLVSVNDKIATTTNSQKNLNQNNLNNADSDKKGEAIRKSKLNSRLEVEESNNVSYQTTTIKKSNNIVVGTKKKSQRSEEVDEALRKLGLLPEDLDDLN